MTNLFNFEGNKFLKGTSRSTWQEDSNTFELYRIKNSPNLSSSCVRSLRFRAKFALSEDAEEIPPTLISLAMMGVLYSECSSVS